MGQKIRLLLFQHRASVTHKPHEDHKDDHDDDDVDDIMMTVSRVPPSGAARRFYSPIGKWVDTSLAVTLWGKRHRQEKKNGAYGRQIFFGAQGAALCVCVCVSVCAQRRCARMSYVHKQTQGGEERINKYNDDTEKKRPHSFRICTVKSDCLLRHYRASQSAHIEKPASSLVVVLSFALRTHSICSYFTKCDF